MQRRRESYTEGSYTGVSAFSSSPAPSTSALIAASVIGNALKENNNNPVGLNIPKVQGPKANRFVRAASITNDTSRRNSLNARNLPDNFVSINRANSINTANARNMSLTSSMAKNRLSYQKSVPNLKGRRSVSDFSNGINRTSQQPQTPVYYKPVPKTIKKYVPSANGLVAVEVPNPAYRGPPPQQQSQSNNQFRRSASVANIPSNATRSQSRVNSVNYSQQQYQQRSPLRQTRDSLTRQQQQEKQSARSISKNVRTETKILPNGTRVVSTTVEEYINDDSDGAYDEAFDDAYDDFDDVHNRNVDMSVTFDEDQIQEEDDDQYVQYTEPADERHVYKNRAQYAEVPAASKHQVLEDESSNYEEELPETVEEEYEEEEIPQQSELHEINEVSEEEFEEEIPKEQIAAKDLNTLRHDVATDDGADEVIDELETQRKYEDDVKNVISKNEELEREEREKAFESIDQPVEDPVILEDLNSRQFAKDLDSNTTSPSIASPTRVPLAVGVGAAAGVAASGIKHAGLFSHGLLSPDASASNANDAEFDQFSDSDLQPAVEQENDGYDDDESNEIAEVEELPEIDEDDEPEDEEEEDYINDIDEDEDHIEDFSTRDLTVNHEEEEYTEEEMLAAQRKLDELVKQKEQEILREMMKNGDLNKGAITDSAIEPEVIEEEKEIVEEPIVEEPIVEEPIVEDPIVEEPIVEEPIVEDPIVEEPIVEEPVVETPVVEASSVKAPVVEAPAVEEPEFIEGSTEIVEEPIAEDKEIEQPTITESSPIEEQFSDAVSVDSHHVLPDDEQQKLFNENTFSPTHSNIPKIISKTNTAQTDASTEASDAELVFHTLSQESSKEPAHDLQPLMMTTMDSSEKFYTPPLTPIVPLSKETSTTSEKLESPSDTLQQSSRSFRRSESPESSMINTENNQSYEARPANKSMAQHLRPIFGSANRPPNSRSAQSSPKKIVPSASTTSAISNGSGKKSGVAVLNISEDFVNNDDEDKDEEVFNDNENELAHLEVPKREPSAQAQIDLAEKRKTIDPYSFNSGELSNSISQEQYNSDADPSENSIGQQEVFNNCNGTRRKSVLKNSSGNNRSSMFIANNQNEASGAYLSLTTAQNTKLNAMGSVYGATPQNPRRQSVIAMDVNAQSRSRSGSAGNAASRSRSGSIGNANSASATTDYAPLAAAAKAAQRHSVQPGSMGYGIGSGLEKTDKASNRNSTTGIPSRETPIRVGGVKAPNPKVEEAKKRILQNRPGQKRAKELYELAKTRPQVKTDQLVALDDTVLRRSSFEKGTDLPEGTTNNARKTNMASMSLRDISAVNYDQYETKKANRGFRSRFHDDHSDTDLPLPPVQAPVVPGYNQSSTSLDVAPSSVHVDASQDKAKSGFKFKLSGLNRKKSRTGMNTTAAPVNISDPIENVHLQNNVSNTTPEYEAHSKPTFFSGLHSHVEENSQPAAPVRESKFEKFFSEPHGPRRNFSSASAATNETSDTVVVNEGGGKKKRGFRFKKMFGDR